MKTISIPTNDRPEHLERVLRSILNCPENQQWAIVFSCEPNAVVQESIERYRSHWPNTLIHRNSVKMGCWVNTFLAAQLSMSWGSELNLYLEDDYELSRDALRMVDQWAKREDSTRTVLCLRRPHDLQRRELPEKVSVYNTGLFGCGFAWKSDLWPVIRDTWWRRSAPMWDIAMEQLNVPQWRPLVNRSHGFGVNGTHSCHSTDPNLFGPAFDGCVETFNFDN